MSELLQFAAFGLGGGAAYALVAQGLIVVYRGAGAVNFAQTAIGALAAFWFYELRSGGTPTWLAMVAALAAAALLGALVHMMVMRRLRSASVASRLVAPLALMALLLSVVEQRYGVVGVPIDSILPEGLVELAGVRVGVDRLVLAGVALVTTVALSVLHHHTAFGRATSASAENEQALAAMGRSPDVVAALNWAIAAGLGALAAVLISSVGRSVSALSLVLLLVPSLAVALAAGFRSFWGCLGAGLALGISESAMARYVTTPGLAKSLPFLVVIVVLIVRGRPLPLRGHVSDRPVSVDQTVRGIVVTLGFVVVAAASVPFLSPSWLDTVITTSIVGIFLLSLVLLVGLAGQLSLAQYAIGGIGAWAASRTIVDWGWSFEAAFVAGIVAAVVVGMVAAIPALRTRGANLAIATLGLAVVIDQTVFQNPARTGGDRGTPIGPAEMFGVPVDAIGHPDRYAWVCLVVLACAACVVWNVRRSSVGRSLLALRDGERVAASLGHRPYTGKVYAFALSSSIAGAAGVLLAFRQPSVVFTGFSPLRSIELVLFAVVGGIGHVLAAPIGALLAPGSVTERLLDRLAGDDSAFLLQAVGAVASLAVLVRVPDGLAALVGGRRRGDRRGRLVDLDHTPTAPGRPTTLEVRNLTVRFGGVTAVDDVTFAVAPGVVVGVIGPNGAGKTSVIDAISGHVDTSDGAIVLGDRRVERLSAASRARLGLCRSFQTIDLFDSLSVDDNLRTAAQRPTWRHFLIDPIAPRPTPIPAAVDSAAVQLGLGEVLAELPASLSFAERRLAAIARCVAAQPSVLLLDEPAAGLTSAETAELGALIRGLAHDRGIGIVLVEHDVDMVFDTADHVVVMDFGRVIASGPPDVVRVDPNVIEAYLGHPTATAGPSSSQTRTSAAVALRVSGVHAGYGGTAVVRDLDLVVHEGEVAVVLGHNGAGKTTALRAIAGEIGLLQGTVSATTVDMRGPLHRRARSGLAYVPEERSIIASLSVEGNLLLGPGAPEVAYAAFPELQPLRHRRAGLLSGGEQQMLTVARALASEPKLLLVDELSLGLAPLPTERLLGMIRAAADRGLAVVLVEQHARRAIDIADRVYVIDHGQVVLEESGERARRDPQAILDATFHTSSSDQHRRTTRHEPSLR